MTDRYGRTIDYARISVTDACNLRCTYCIGTEAADPKPPTNILQAEEIIQIAEALTECGIEKIRITGGEPLVHREILPIVKGVRQINRVKTLALTTNGLLLPQYAQALYEAKVDRVNISIDTLDPDKYRKITGGGNLQDVLRGVQEAANIGFQKLALNVVLIKGFNDNEVNSLIDLTMKFPVDVRFIELMAIGSQAEWAVDRYVSTKTVLGARPALELLEAKDRSSPAAFYRIPGGKGCVGLISPLSHKFCKYCNRIRITSDGKIKACLHSDEEVPLKPSIHNKKQLIELIQDAIASKPQEHRLENEKYIRRDMSKIGG